MTSSISVRSALALVLTAAPLAVAGCRSVQGSGLRGDGFPGAPPVLAAPPVRAESTLDNGVRVVVEENHLAPLVAIEVWVAAGAADDPPALAGAAHLFEHLVQRGGKRWGPGGGARQVEAVGGTVGAWTGLDETVYHALVAAPFVELGLEVLADAIANPSFDAAEVDRARRLALDEIASSAADPRQRANQALFAAAFGGDPHGRPLLGTAASVAALTPAALAAHFPETHGAGSLTVIVVGDVDAATAATVKRAFGTIPPGRRAPAPDSVPGKTARVTVTTGGGSPPEIVVGFRTGGLATKEIAALDLLAAVLARGEGARLQRELVRNRQLADGVRPFSFRTRDAGLAAFAVTPAPRRIAQAAEATVDLALRAALDPATTEEIAAARAALESDLARAGEGPLARARRLGFAAAIARDPDEETRYLEAIRSAGAAELQEAAARSLNLDHLTVAVALPDPPAGRDETAAALAPRLEAMVAAAPALAARHAAPTPRAAGGGGAVRFVTPAGVRVLVLSDGAAPLVSIEAAWLERGAGRESGEDDAANLIAALLERGTRTRSAPDVEAEVRAIGGVLKGFAAPGVLGLRADFLPQHLARGLALVTDCLARPAFDDREVDAAQRALVARTRDEARAADASMQAALRLFHETLSGEAARRASGDPAPALGRFALLDRYRRRYPLGQLIVAVVGNVDPPAVAAALTAAFPGAPLDGSAAPPTVTRTAPAASPTASVVPAPPTTVFRNSPTGEAAAVVGYAAVAPGDPSRPAVEVLAEILAGAGGRVAAGLGGATGNDRLLACRTGVRLSGTPGQASAYLAATVVCPPASLDAAVAAVRTALAQVATAGVTPDEVSRAGRRLVGLRAAALRTRMAVADALVRDESAGLPTLSYRRATEGLMRVAAADVTRAAQAVLAPGREIIAVTRPPGPAAALAGATKQGKAGAER